MKRKLPMLFSYKGIDVNGLKVKSKLEANSLEDAKLRLKAKGVIYTSIKEDKLSFFNFSFKRAKKLDLNTLSSISRDISIYLSSGLTLIECIKLLNQRYKENKVLNTFFENIKSHLDEGKSFYDALETQNIVSLPEFYKQSIKVSENAGLLQSVLMQVSKFLKEQEKIRKQIKVALAYPSFILLISLFMLGFMLTFIVPKITSIFSQLNQELPSSTQFVINLGNFFSSNYHLVLLVLISCIFSFVFLLKKSSRFRFFIDKSLLKIPFFSKVIEHNELSRFAYMNSILIKSGVPIAQAINLSANILKNTVFKEVFLNSSKSIVEGERLSSFLQKNKIHKIDEAFIHSISIGEDTSRLDETLDTLAKLYQESNKDKTDVFLSLLEPIFMLFVGGSIGFIVISMLLPIFSMNLG